MQAGPELSGGLSADSLVEQARLDRHDHRRWRNPPRQFEYQIIPSHLQAQPWWAGQGSRMVPGWSCSFYATSWS